MCVVKMPAVGGGTITKVVCCADSDTWTNVKKHRLRFQGLCKCWKAMMHMPWQHPVEMLCPRMECGVAGEWCSVWFPLDDRLRMHVNHHGVCSWSGKWDAGTSTFRITLPAASGYERTEGVERQTRIVTDSSAIVRLKGYTGGVSVVARGLTSGTIDGNNNEHTLMRSAISAPAPEPDGWKVVKIDKRSMHSERCSRRT